MKILPFTSKITLLFCFLTSNAWASDLPTQISKAVQQHFPGIDNELVAVGDLNQDGLIDFAVITADKKLEDHSRVVVMLATSATEFKRYAISGLIPDSPRRSPGNYLEFKKDSLFLRRTGSNGAPSDWLEAFQFKFRDQALVLIGEESATLGKGEQADHADGKSINYLSNQVIFWRTDGTKRKELGKKFTAAPLTKLEQFDHSKHEQQKTKILRSYLDENFQLRP